MEHTSVIEIVFWRFDKPLLKIAIVRRQLMYEKCIDEHIIIIPDCSIGYLERSTHVIIVAQLSIEMSCHGPKLMVKARIVR